MAAFTQILPDADTWTLFPENTDVFQKASGGCIVIKPDRHDSVVYGLHVPWNLKIVTKKRNLELGDHFDCDLPCGPGCHCGEVHDEDSNGDFDDMRPF